MEFWVDGCTERHNGSNICNLIVSAISFAIVIRRACIRFQRVLGISVNSVFGVGTPVSLAERIGD